VKLVLATLGVLVALGLNPRAPGFEADADDMKPAGPRWATKFGIRFTGMPESGPSRSDQELGT